MLLLFSDDNFLNKIKNIKSNGLSQASRVSVFLITILIKRASLIKDRVISRTFILEEVTLQKVYPLNVNHKIDTVFNTNPEIIYSKGIQTKFKWRFNSSLARQNGRHFTDDIFKCIFVNEKFCISNQILLKFVPKDQINKKSAFVQAIQVMAWCRTGDKPLPEPVPPSSLTHIWRQGDELKSWLSRFQISLKRFLIYCALLVALKYIIPPAL